MEDIQIWVSTCNIQLPLEPTEQTLRSSDESPDFWQDELYHSKKHESCESNNAVILSHVFLSSQTSCQNQALKLPTHASKTVKWLYFMLHLQIKCPLISGRTFKHDVFTFSSLKDCAYLTGELFYSAGVFFMYQRMKF